jgi:hypothetical protein
MDRRLLAWEEAKLFHSDLCSFVATPVYVSKGPSVAGITFRANVYTVHK